MLQKSSFSICKKAFFSIFDFFGENKPYCNLIDLQCCPIFVSKLITMAEPHLSGIKVERCARTVQQAQKEVLICIGICLHDR